METSGLDDLVSRSDWRGMRGVLVAMSDDELATARRWYRRSGRAQARTLAEADWQDHSRIMQLLLAVSLCDAAEEASRNCRWGRRAVWSDEHQGLATCAVAAIERGPQWGAEFVDAATSVMPRGGAQHGASEIVNLTSALVSAHGLSVPQTEAYVRGWAAIIVSTFAHFKAAAPGHWLPLTVLRAEGTDPRPAYPLGQDSSLRACLVESPAASQLLAAALALPNAFGEWSTFSLDGWRVEPTVRELVASGVLDRQPLLDGVFAALSRDDKAANQRTVAQILTGLDPTPEEIRERSALILHVVPTVHGSVTKTLLPMALGADLPDGELLELGTVILARTEKAQKATLIAHLAKTTGEARNTLLRLVADGDDAGLAAKAESLLGSSECSREPSGTAVPTEVAAGMSWSLTPEPWTPDPYTPYAATGRGLDQARSDEETWSRITSEAAYLDLVVRMAHARLGGSERLRAIVAGQDGPNRYSNVRTPYLLHAWATSGTTERSYQYTATSHTYTGAGTEAFVRTDTFTMRPPAHLVFTDQLVGETLARLDALSELLSTPTRSDGTLDAATLAKRVRRASDYGPYDLVQALLRLGPTSPSDAAHFDGLSLAPAGSAEPTARRWLTRRRSSAGQHDGVEVIRSWITAGGLRPRAMSFSGASPRSRSVTLPLPEWLLSLEGLGGIRAGVGGDDERHRPWGMEEPGPWLGVCPWEVENLATMIASREDPESVVHAQRLPLMVQAAGPVGDAVHALVAQLLAHPRLDSRLLTASAAGEWARQGRLDPEVLAARSLAWFEAGSLSLGRAAHGWEALAVESSVSTVWPTVVAVLDAACRAAKKPPGLADALRVTRGLAGVASAQLGRQWLPASVRELAAAKGSSKAAIEARALVAAVESAESAGSAGSYGSAGGA